MILRSRITAGGSVPEIWSVPLTPMAVVAHDAGYGFLDHLESAVLIGGLSCRIYEALIGRSQDATRAASIADNRQIDDVDRSGNEGPFVDGFVLQIRKMKLAHIDGAAALGAAFDRTHPRVTDWHVLFRHNFVAAYSPDSAWSSNTRDRKYR
ncbi:hypothetical protein [Paraburkholderia youngii]|uniref:Uncharacterized protein n=1 Tax=Paraburkholderia youngii TaxID=2782701 RepID=A0A7Y6JW01_9BURK|nr:hypothetical protein [Paraburkholderia youngii]NUX99739.1 hypothetical protein [Paraburkholderia youngii]